MGKVAEIDENLTDLDNDMELLYAYLGKVAEIDENLTNLDNDT